MLMANDAEICIRNRSQKTVCLIHATGRIFEMSIETKKQTFTNIYTLQNKKKHKSEQLL